MDIESIQKLLKNITPKTYAEVLPPESQTVALFGDSYCSYN